MNEATDIANTAGYSVVGQFIQHRDAVDARFCVGEGKVDEIAESIRKEPVEAVIFAQQLSAGQVFRIQKKLGGKVRILDRNLLILEVFEKRGATAEAKLQVTLARLRYTFSWAGNPYACAASLANRWVGEGQVDIHTKSTKPCHAKE